MKKLLRLVRAESAATLGLAFLLCACGEETPSGTGGGGGAAGTAGGGGGANGGSAGASGAAGGDAGPFLCTSSGSTGKWISIPAGSFLMGCNEAVDADCHADEKPSREVTLQAFEIHETEVTQDQYTACVVAGKCDAPLCAWDCTRANFPAGCLTWARAKQFCTFAGARLPTEAEWEKAARGSDGRKYPWGNTEPTCNEVNMSGCGDEADAVGSHPAGASPYGALDMAGNMVEMVADWYDAAYYQSAPSADPPGPASGTRYVGRGGGYKSLPVWQRASSRDWYDPPDFGVRLGFRCAK